MKEFYLLELNRPAGVSVGRMKEYIKIAVECWSGQFDPSEDPLFGWFSKHGNAVTVKRILQEEKSERGQRPV